MQCDVRGEGMQCDEGDGTQCDVRVRVHSVM